MENFDVDKFHAERIAFVIMNNKIIYLNSSFFTHNSWFESYGIDKAKYNKIIRGFYYNNEIRFYVGENFETNEKVELAAIKYYPKIVVDLKLDNPILCVGCLATKNNTYFKPIKKLQITEKMKKEILITELKNHVPFDKTEADNVLKSINFLKNSNDCFKRENTFGHFTSGAMIINKQGKVLLDYHKKLNIWVQFGGHADGETDLLKNAVKEVMEETGLREITLVSNGIFDVNVVEAFGGVDGKNHYHFDINYLFYSSKDDFIVSEESINLKWCTINEAFKIIDKADVGLKRMLQKIEIIINKENANEI